MFRILAMVMMWSAFVWPRDLNKEFELAQFEINGHKIQAYIADNDDKRSRGLMFVDKIPEDSGMIFVFDVEQPLGFWMKNTLIPLSIGFFNKAGVLIDIQEMRVAKSLMDRDPPTYQSHGSGLFALEMNTGWFSRHHITKGVHLKLISPTRSSLLKDRLPN